jgi:hypothetical protein
VGLALSLVLTGVCAQAADPFHRLSAQEIRAKIIGNVFTDDTHWSQHFRPDGTLHSIALSRLRQGTWHIDGDTLCRTLTRRGKTTTACSEVWMWQDRVEYRDRASRSWKGSCARHGADCRAPRVRCAVRRCLHSPTGGQRMVEVVDLPPADHAAA